MNPNMKRSMAVISGFILSAFLVSCVSRHHHSLPEECPPPSWTQCPKINDSVNLYRVGSATGEPTAAAAREAAFKDAVRQINQTIMREAGGAVGRGGALPLVEVEILPGCSYTAETLSGYNGWVQVSFPLAEKNRLVESFKSRNDR